MILIRWVSNIHYILIQLNSYTDKTVGYIWGQSFHVIIAITGIVKKKKQPFLIPLFVKE